MYCFLFFVFLAKSISLDGRRRPCPLEEGLKGTNKIKIVPRILQHFCLKENEV